MVLGTPISGLGDGLGGLLIIASADHTTAGCETVYNVGLAGYTHSQMVE